MVVIMQPLEQSHRFIDHVGNGDTFSRKVFDENFS